MESDKDKEATSKARSLVAKTRRSTKYMTDIRAIVMHKYHIVINVRTFMTRIVLMMMMKRMVMVMVMVIVMVIL